MMDLRSVGWRERLELRMLSFGSAISRIKLGERSGVYARSTGGDSAAAGSGFLIATGLRGLGGTTSSSQFDSSEVSTCARRGY